MVNAPFLNSRRVSGNATVIGSAFLGATVAVACLVLVSCVSPARHAPPSSNPVQTYELETWSRLPGWSADDMQAAWPVFLASCRALRFRAEWVASCAAAQAVDGGSAAEIRGYFERNFDPYQIRRLTGRVREDTGLITGYYEPLLAGSRTQSAQFNAPLYAPPPDLLTVDLASLYPELQGKRVRGRLDGKRIVPYYSRADLAADPAVHGMEIVWIDNALDAFMFEVQGSGRVRLPDSTTIRLQYADQNGHPYRSIGRYLVEHGPLTADQATMPGIRAWLAANPQRLQEVLNANPSVIFFKEGPLGDPTEGPKGAQGIPLTAGRSIAVDPRFVPLGAPVFLATTLPGSDQPLQRLVFAQDTGGAINGAPRADFFWGTGAEAADLAGRMRQQGSMWLLWPKGSALDFRKPDRLDGEKKK